MKPLNFVCEINKPTKHQSSVLLTQAVAPYIQNNGERDNTYIEYISVYCCGSHSQ